MTSIARALAATALFLLVVPVALAGAAGGSGGPQATASASVNKKVKKLTKRVSQLEQQLAAFEGTPGTPGPAGPQGPPGPSTGAAGGDLIGTFPNPLIAGDAVGPAEIQNPTRSVNLPLGSFVNLSAEAPIAWGQIEGEPNFRESGPGDGFILEWDDDSDGVGADNADIGSVASTFTVPVDYASGGSFAARLSKDANTAGEVERFRCRLSINDSVFTSTGAAPTITSPTIASYTVTPAGSFAAGDAVHVACGADDGVAFGNDANDFVRLHSIEFNYTATQ